MDTFLLWTVSLIALVLIVLALMFWLYLRSERRLREDTETQRTEMARVLEIALALSTNSSQRQDSLLASQRQQQSDLLQVTREEMARTQTLAQQSMDLTMTRALGGFEAQARSMQELVAQQSALLATKDPMAYMQVHSAPAPLNAEGMYPAADEGAERVVTEAEQQAAGLEAAQFLLSKMGDSGGGSGFGPYSGATGE